MARRVLPEPAGPGQGHETRNRAANELCEDLSDLTFTPDERARRTWQVVFERAC